jgi:hypothetical protein
MKKIILAMTILALAGSQVQTAKAGGCGWPVAAGVFGGLAVGTAIGATVAQSPVYCAPAPAYVYPPVAYSSPPVVYQRPVVVARPVAVVSPVRVVYAPPVYVVPPVVGIGFGRPYYYGAYCGRFCGYPRYYGRGRW